MTEGRTMKGGVYAKPEGPRPEGTPGGVNFFPKSEPSPTRCDGCAKSILREGVRWCRTWDVETDERSFCAMYYPNSRIGDTRGIPESRPLGRKFDDAKPRWSLLPTGTIKQIIAVLEYGAKKYDADNWKLVPNATVRYYDAMMRHVHAWRDGEPCDTESGLHHLAHAACCALFLLWFEMRGVKEISTPDTGQISTSVPPELVGQGRPTGGSDS